jgi:NADPH2:quinone reductase
MKALLCRQYGPPESLTFEDTAEPVAGPGEVVVSMRAASVNFPDVLIIQGRYQFKPPFPFSPGSEAAGVVRSVGEGVEGVAPGDRVVTLPGFGCFAEQIAVHASRVWAMPAGMDFVTASAFTLTYGTAMHALVDRGAVRSGETLVVLGAAGGVGLAAVEIGKAVGARVIACASSAAKLEACRAHGADDTIDYSTDDLRDRLKALTDGRGADVVYDPVGGPLTEAAARSLAWRGRLLVVGFAAGDIPKLALNLPLLKGSSIVGVFFGEFTRREPAAFARQFGQLADWYAEGRLRPQIAEVLPLDRAAEGIAKLALRAVTGKVVVVPGSPDA